MRSWRKKYPPYEGEEPYLYLAFAEADEKRVWKLLRPLLERGCRVWYCYGPSGSGEELLRRQERSGGAGLTVLFLTDAACADRDTKSSILVNQKFDRPLLCVDGDGTDRRLTMGLREDVPHLSLRGARDGELVSAVLHAPGFSQEMLGPPVKTRSGGLGTLTALFSLLAALAAAAILTAPVYLPRSEPEIADEMAFSDDAILSALREEAHGGAVTRELTEGLTILRLSRAPESWDDLTKLPALERITLPQQALLDGAVLPEGDYVVELTGGGA